MSSALALSAFTAATAFISIALASSAVPLVCCAKPVGENIRTAPDIAAIIDARSMTFLLFWYIAMWETPGEFRKAYFPGPPSYRVSPRRCNRRSLADPPCVRRLFPPDRRRRGGDGAGGHRASRGGVSCTPLILRARLSAIPP